MRINIYHTNDLHSDYEALKRINTYLKKHKTQNDFYFDSGDYTDLKSSIVQADRGVSAMELMCACKLDAMCIGNNEIDMGAGAISNLACSGVPLVSCNVTDNDDNVFQGLSASMILERCGKRFLVLGVSPYYNWKLEPDAYNLFFMMGNVKTHEPIVRLRSEIEAYKGEYDFCILLSHSGVNVDNLILKEIPEIDLCLGGHSHDIKSERGYSQSGFRGEKLGKVTLEIDEKGIREIESVQIELEDEANPEFDVLFEEKQKKADEILSIPMEVVRELPFDSFKESELINFICDALKKDFECDFAFIHAGIAESSLIRPVSKKSLIENFPSKLNPTCFPVSGKAIKEAVILSLDEEHIRQDGKGAGFRGHVLGTLGFSSNVRITKNPLQIMIDGQVLDEEGVYRVTSDDYLQRGTGYPSLKVSDDMATFDKRFIRDLVEDHLMDEKLFESAKIQRIIE